MSYNIVNKVTHIDGLGLSAWDYYTPSQLVEMLLNSFSRVIELKDRYAHYKSEHRVFQGYNSWTGRGVYAVSGKTPEERVKVNSKCRYFQDNIDIQNATSDSVVTRYVEVAKYGSKKDLYKAMFELKRKHVSI